MDLQSLSSLFRTTYDPDMNVRNAGELHIRRIGNEQGFISALLQIIGSSDFEIGIRQACAVWIKNRVHSSYSVDFTSVPRSDQGHISDLDRTALRQALIPFLSHSPNRGVATQLADALKTIIAHDFPAKWPELLATIKTYLVSAEINRIHAGCIAALECVRAFRFRQKPDVMSQIVVELFPTLVNIAAQMLPTPTASSGQDGAIPTMLHLILKTYKTSISVSLSTHQQGPSSIVPWGQLLFSMVQFPIPQDAVPVDEEERELCEWWKAKKWAYGTLGRLFHRYGNPSQLPPAMQKEYGQFAQHFVTAFAPEILNVFMRQVELHVSNQAWLSKKCQVQIFQFFTECVKPKSTWTLLKPHFEALVKSYIFPQLSFTNSKRQLWELDPVDYLRLTIDEYDDYTTPVSTVSSFLISLASNRTKATFMPILAAINSVLQSRAPAPDRFGALNMTVILGPWIMRHPDVQNNMQEFMLQYVLPEFASNEPYMRAVACEVVATMTKAGLEWRNDENLATHSRSVAMALDDPELPVRVHAALALTEMTVAHEFVKAAIAPQVEKVITDLLKLSDETDLDLLNKCMDIMVEQFQTELLPVAAQLTSRLCESYLRLVKEISGHETQEVGADGGITLDMENDKTIPAISTARTLITIVSSVESSLEMLSQIQEVIIPIVKFTLDHKILDLFDAMYEIVDALTYKLRTISPNMWSIFEQTYSLFKSDAVDFLEEMLPTLDNFISFGADVINARPHYKQMLLEIYTTSIDSEQLGEHDAVNGCKLAESMMLNLRGNIDDALQTIINTSLPLLDSAQSSILRLGNLEVLVNAVLYNPTAALHFIETFRAGMSREFFEQWFAAITDADQRLPRVHDKKLNILALCALLELPPQSIPELLQQGWPGIAGGILKIFKGLPKAIEARKALEESLQEESDEEDDLDERVLNMNEDDEDVWDAESTYLALLADEGARIRAKEQQPDVASDDVEADGNDDSDSDDEPEIDEELGYLSPLDKINPYQSFKQALTTFQMQNPAGYQAATTMLDVDQQTLLMEVMRLAEMPSEA